MKKLLNLIIVVLVLIAVPLCGLRIMGYTPYTIESDSMSPTYEENDIVYIKETEFDNIKIGDVVSFINSNNKIVTHRVSDINTEERCLFTKGDNNKFQDIEPVYEENIIGTVKFSIPKVGIISIKK